MVKGVAKRVIVVDSPDPQLFEQAIFIVRGNALEGEGGVTARQVIAEACQVANGYAKKNAGKRWSGKFHLPAPAFAALGAMGTALVWLAVTLL